MVANPCRSTIAAFCRFRRTAISLLLPHSGQVHHRKKFRNVRTDPEGIAESLTLSGPFACASVVRGCAASRRPPASCCDPYRDIRPPVIPIGIPRCLLSLLLFMWLGGLLRVVRFSEFGGLRFIGAFRMIDMES